VGGRRACVRVRGKDDHQGTLDHVQ